MSRWYLAIPLMMVILIIEFKHLVQKSYEDHALIQTIRLIILFIFACYFVRVDMLCRQGIGNISLAFMFLCVILGFTKAYAWLNSQRSLENETNRNPFIAMLMYVFMLSCFSAFYMEFDLLHSCNDCDKFRAEIKQIRRKLSGGVQSFSDQGALKRLELSDCICYFKRATIVDTKGMIILLCLMTAFTVFMMMINHPLPTTILDNLANLLKTPKYNNRCICPVFVVVIYIRVDLVFRND